MAFSSNATKSMPEDEPRAGHVGSLRMTPSGESFALEPTLHRWVVGSSESCDIVIDVAYVSSVHCVIERQPRGMLVVRDRGSRNGTRVDGTPIEACALRVGSYLAIGRTTLVAVSSATEVHRSALESMRGTDATFRRTVDNALKAAQSDCNVLVVGETGTGKDLLARVIHETSRRHARNFVAVNCGAIPRELVAAELFGHERGAFTSAHAERDGYFVEADGGTLFLDEIGELPLELQPNLLRALEGHKVRRVGSMVERTVDVRIVAATNRLDGLGSDTSRLRLDLYHRVAAVVLALPPMRERMSDLHVLVDAMLDDFAAEHGPKHVTDDAWRALASYAWPGNVRELRHAVARAVALGGNELGPRDFFPDSGFGRRLASMAGCSEGDDPLAPYQAMLRTTMEQALATHGSIRAAANHLGMAKSTFADKAKAWGLQPRRKQRQQR
jgi:DNA-binding NtrC family response regulator